MNPHDNPGGCTDHDPGEECSICHQAAQEDLKDHLAAEGKEALFDDPIDDDVEEMFDDLDEHTPEPIVEDDFQQRLADEREYEEAIRAAAEEEARQYDQENLAMNARYCKGAIVIAALGIAAAAFVGFGTSIGEHSHAPAHRSCQSQLDQARKAYEAEKADRIKRELPPMPAFVAPACKR